MIKAARIDLRSCLPDLVGMCRPIDKFLLCFSALSDLLKFGQVVEIHHP
jgi:hypothetical protein